MPRQVGADDAKRRRKCFGNMSYDVAEDRTIPEYVPLTCPKRTLKSTLYKLMAKRATSYFVCELRPALNVPILVPSVAV